MDVIERIWGIDGKADEDDMRVGIGKWTKTIVVFLTSCIPKGQLNMLAVNLDVGNVILEDGGNIDLDIECKLIFPDAR